MRRDLQSGAKADEPHPPCYATMIAKRLTQTMG